MERRCNRLPPDQYVTTIHGAVAEEEDVHFCPTKFSHVYTWNAPRPCSGQSGSDVRPAPAPFPNAWLRAVQVLRVAYPLAAGDLPPGASRRRCTRNPLANSAILS